MTLRFGTDGVRGDASRDLPAPLIQAFGRAAGEVLGPSRFVVARDTRESGERIAADLVAGLSAGGSAATYLGMAPTPAVAHRAHHDNVPAAVVSASHNPWTDNGVKLFATGGLKLDDDAEAEVEARLAELMSADDEARSRSSTGSALEPVEGALDGYLQHLTRVLEGRRLDGMRVVLDCANGAASEVAPRVLRSAGAQVVAIHAEPNGRNINDGCGSTDPSDLARAVPAAGADAGLAFDGDADRVIAVDERGEVVDGDQMILIAALDLRARGRLRNDGVAVTVMSNLGLRRALTDAAITVVTTPVGDRHVLAAMADHRLALGGEQSGHIVFSDHATTGDGVLTGLVLLDTMRRQSAPLSELAASMRRFPQVLANVRLDQPADLGTATAVWDAVAAEEAELGDEGRVLVRASGTEPVVRVMVEASEREKADLVAEHLVGVVQGWFNSTERAS